MAERTSLRSASYYIICPSLNSFYPFEIPLMDTINVLIIDENILVRRAITTILQKNDQFRVYWIHDNFENIETVVQEKQPDVILLSIESLEADGLEVLQRLQEKFISVPVIVISPRNEKGAKAAISALRLGAVDFITKPEQKNLILFAERHLEKRLGPLIKSAYRIKDSHRLDKEILDSFTQPQKTFEDFGTAIADQNKAEIVVIGGCTGGVQALFTILRNLPADLDVPIIVVQHLPRTYTECLAENLDSFCDITVREATNSEKLSGGNVYIAPGGYQCEVSQTGYDVRMMVHRGLRENNMRPSIDVLFRSAAKVYQQKTLGILLSGCGYDGFSGAAEIKKTNGQFIVQDPRTAIAFELPVGAIRKGLTKEYYTPQQLARQIQKRTFYNIENISKSTEETTNPSFLF